MLVRGTGTRQGGGGGRWPRGANAAGGWIICLAMNPAPKRRSTIGVHPTVSESPHLKRSIPYPKTDLAAKIKLHPDEYPHGPQVYSDVIFRNKIGIPTIFC